jgi:hypothetical protein
MACNKCKSNRCGCGDTPINMPNSYSNDPTVCPPNSEKCSEVFDMACICYGGDDIVELDIKKGTRMDEVLQKLVLAINNPGCSDFFDPLVCQSPLNLTVSNITTNTFGISWDAVLSAVSYTVEYKNANTTSWLLNPSVVAPTVNDTIIGLTPETVYDIRVNAICATGGCYSLNIRIQTLPLQV